MIEKEELERIAKIKNLAVKNAEKDYLLELLLFRLYNEAGDAIIFKGGTALYKLYSLNRFSEDLDFTVKSSKIDLIKMLGKAVKKLNDSGVGVKIKETSDFNSQTNSVLEFKGPLFDGNPKNLTIITLNFSKKEKPIYLPERRKIFSQYTDIPAFDVFVMQLNELFAEKVRALMTRDKARDAYDVWFLLNKNAAFQVRDIDKKLGLYKSSFKIKSLIAKLNEAEKSWESDLKGIIMGTLPDFTEVKKEILAKIKGKYSK